MHIFQGNQYAQTIEARLTPLVGDLKKRGILIKIVAILFQEDKGSRLYTRLKKEAAERIGMQYEIKTFSMEDDLQHVLQTLQELNKDETVTGIIIQKPAKAVWQTTTGGSADEFQTWWHTLVIAIDPHKDVDGLHPETLKHIEMGDWKEAGCVMPATAKACLTILQKAEEMLKIREEKKIVILGKSDILGKPLYYEFKNQQQDVEMIGSKELQERKQRGIDLKDADIIISATGREGLITGNLLKNDAIIIDVGEPKPDVDRTSVEEKAAFLTPVPGGVGPVTIVSLLENALFLAQKHLL